MIACDKIANIFKKNSLTYFTGVPDTILKDWTCYISNNEDKFTHRIAANEGAAIAHATGYYLATGKLGVVYMQNSGLGNAVNPLVSLADSNVFGIPMLLMIGWRGEPGKRDEPQHEKTGRVMLPLLDSLEISWEILNTEEIEEQIKRAKENAVEKNTPVALIVRKDFFEEYKNERKKDNSLQLSRERAISVIVGAFEGDEIVVATTGKTSRELFEIRKAGNQDCSGDFYVVGSMGHAGAIAADVACHKPHRKVYIFDGDGALIMHAGTLATIGAYAPKNLVHVVFDNCSHESTGGQPTVSDRIDIAAMARSCNYVDAKVCFNEEEIRESIRNIKNGPVMIVVKVKSGSRKDLGRPTMTPAEHKISFMKKLI